MFGEVAMVKYDVDVPGSEISWRRSHANDRQASGVRSPSEKALVNASQKKGGSTMALRICCRTVPELMDLNSGDCKYCSNLVALLFKNGRVVSNLIEAWSAVSPNGLEMNLCAIDARSLCTVVASRNSLPSRDAVHLLACLGNDSKGGSKLGP